MKAVALAAMATVLGCSPHRRECGFLVPAVDAAEDAMRAPRRDETLSGISPSAYAAARSASAGRWLASFQVDEPDLEPLRDRLERAMQGRADALEQPAASAGELARANERAADAARALREACAR